MQSYRANKRRRGHARARFGVLAFMLATAFLVSSDLVVKPVEIAYAADYPTWDDVANARNNEAAAQNQIAAIEALIRQLEDNAKRAQEDAVAKGARWGELDSLYQAAAGR